MVLPEACPNETGNDWVTGGLPPPSAPSIGRKPYCTPPGPPPFRLTRHFSLTSLAGVLVVMCCLLLFYREHTTNRLAQEMGQANADSTRLLANVLWPEYRSFVLGPAGRDRAQLMADPRQQQLQDRLRDAMRGLTLVKLKIYDRAGLTVFSTDPSQVGDRQPGNPGLLQEIIESARRRCAG